MDATTVWDLPDEVFTAIFSYLPFRDRKSARSVCKHWYTICESACLTRNDVISVEWHHELEGFAMSRSDFKLRIKFFENPLKEISFWKCFGPEVKELELLSGHLRSPIFNFIFSFCENLQSLSICGRHNVDSSTPIFYYPCSFKDLNHLSTLYLTYLDNITRKDFEKLTKHAPKLTRFGLRSYNTDLEIFDDWDSVFPAVIEMIRRQSSNLVELDFNECFDLNNETFESILNVIGPQLAELNLAGCSYWYQCSALIADRIPNLIKIDLRSTHLNMESYLTIFKSLKKLKIVSLSSTDISDAVVSSVLDLEDLEQLDLSWCNYLTLNGMVQVFTRRLLPKMYKLYLKCVRSHPDQVFEDILPLYLPNLNDVKIDIVEEEFRRPGRIRPPFEF